MTRSPTPVSGQTWQSLTQPSRTITVTTADESWTHFSENQERTHRNEPKPGIVRTRDLPRNFRLTNPTP